MYWESIYTVAGVKAIFTFSAEHNIPNILIKYMDFLHNASIYRVSFMSIQATAMDLNKNLPQVVHLTQGSHTHSLHIQLFPYTNNTFPIVSHSCDTHATAVRKEHNFADISKEP
jgi:hypothetical protein